MSLRIAVYAISKNEEKFVERCLRSAKDADLFVLADTGSTDQTVQIARDMGAQVHTIVVRPWRFDMARNASLSLVPVDVDVCVCIDIDEIMEPGWREEVEEKWVLGQTTRMRYLFDWGCGVVFRSDKIHAREGYLWKQPCHECLTPYGDTPERFVDTEKKLVTHLPDPEKSRGQYLNLLRWGAREDPSNVRNSFYFGRELTFYKKWPEAEVELKRYLQLPGSCWSAERSLAMRLIGQARAAQGDLEGALTWFQKGVQEAPERREPWVALAQAYYERKMWNECFDVSTSALAVTEYRHLWPNEPAAWGWKPHDLLALAAYYLGRYDVAVQHGARALEFEPEDPRLQMNMQFYLNAIGKET